MDDKKIQELITRQGQVIATLALRVTILEQLLLEKKVISEEESAKKATELDRQFTIQLQEALRRAKETSQRE